MTAPLLLRKIAITAVAVSASMVLPTASALPAIPAPGGGFQACTADACGTIGYAWADDSGAPVGHVTVAHLVSEVGQQVTSTAFNGVPVTTMTTLKSTHDADLSVVSAVSSDLSSSITLSDGTVLTVSGYATEGDIKSGQRVCHSGWNGTTATMHEVCGTVDSIGPSAACQAAGTGTSTCVVLFAPPAGTRGGGPGDSGAAAYSYQPDGSVTVIGNYRGTTTEGKAIIEPVYAAIQIFGGRPYLGGTIIPHGPLPAGLTSGSNGS
ncbi:MAG: hypothetical protein JWN03_2479 [Nocardia sp.]|uniref:hypothetical protein n=1 Tax=Nocardia sp. TaxID=1821 RepID=UPI002603C29E|nr:hypothetical protein [Nocardia sp.]MCU1642204.1 hypothetical protein [Nocardia sp.]